MPVCVYIYIYYIYTHITSKARVERRKIEKKERRTEQQRGERARARDRAARKILCSLLLLLLLLFRSRERPREMEAIRGGSLSIRPKRPAIYSRSLARSLLIDGSREYLFFLLLLLFAGRARELADQMPLGVLARPARGSRRPNEKKRIRRSSGARRPRRSLSLSLSLYPSFFFYLQSGCARSLVAYAKENKRERASWLQPAH